MSPLVVPRPGDRIILGLFTFGPDVEAGARLTDLGALNKALDHFQSRGYNEVDTARSYVDGKQESWTRAANWKERGLTLATKVEYPTKLGDNSADRVIESVDTSLRELGTDCIDIMYLHSADRATPFAETFGALDKLHKQGKFVRLGLSNFTAYEVAEVVMTCKHNNWVRPTIYQGMYNCITRGLETEVFHACRRYGLDIVVYNPLAGGLFSGKIKSKDIVPETGRFSDVFKIGRLYRDRYFKDSTFRALQLVEAAAEKSGLTMIEIALRWCVHHSELRVKAGNDGIIIGVSSVEHLDENLTDLEKGPLPEEVVKTLDEAWMAAKVDTPPYYHMKLEYTYDTRKVLFGEGSGVSK